MSSEHGPVRQLVERLLRLDINVTDVRSAADALDVEVAGMREKVSEWEDIANNKFDGEVQSVSARIEGDDAGTSLFVRGHEDKEVFCEAVGCSYGYEVRPEDVVWCWMHLGPDGSRSSEEGYDYFQYLHDSAGSGRFKVTYLELSKLHRRERK